MSQTLRQQVLAMVGEDPDFKPEDVRPSITYPVLVQQPDPRRTEDQPIDRRRQSLPSGIHDVGTSRNE